ncbi:MAG TPA: lytic transglycosylase domain-containing protein [Solirubrobacterales bacterium]|nr:lytic transglycosylase domain-containing protein [Solirubrobacterales bacterium]
MSGPRSNLGSLIRRRVAMKVLARVGKAKLAVAGALALAAFLLFLVLLAALAGAKSSGSGGGELCTTSGGSKSPPAKLLRIYPAAAAEYELGPRGPGILAAINYVESDFGRSPLPGVARGTQNGAGAEGPMQFLQSSWEAYGVDGNGDGVKDVYDATDAIFGAANLLHAEGAPGDWYGAIWHYNHADWYVRKVERIAGEFGGVSCTARPGSLPAQPVGRLLYVAQWIESRKIPYCWGGGHGARPGPSGGSYCWNAAGEQVFGSTAQGLDCSGSVRWLLVLAGYPDPGALVSGQFATAYPSGPGRAVTIWSNAEHVFIEIDGRDWGTSESNFAHGPGFADHTTEGFAASHPAGL